jgi:hypothetical protein
MKTLLATTALLVSLVPASAQSSPVTANEADGCRVIVEAVSDKPVTDCPRLKATMKASSDSIKDIQDCTLYSSILWSSNHFPAKDVADAMTAAVEGRQGNGVNIAPPLLVRQAIMRGCIMIIKDWTESEADRVVKKIEWSR